MSEASVIKNADRKYKNADRLIDSSLGGSFVLPANALVMDETATITPAIPIYIKCFSCFVIPV